MYTSSGRRAHCNACTRYTLDAPISDTCDSRLHPVALGSGARLALAWPAQRHIGPGLSPLRAGSGLLLWRQLLLLSC
jgi:hypothetical protein